MATKMSLIAAKDSKNIERLLGDPLMHPKVRELGKKLIDSCQDENIYLRVTQGYRSFREQDELYARGRTAPGKIVTNAKAGKSWHNFGLAFDVVILDSVTGTAIWNTNDSRWGRVSYLGQSIGLKQISITSKGKKWIDIPHFEWHPGVTLATMSKEYMRGVSLLDLWKLIKE